jgi:hypothetical protein
MGFFCRRELQKKIGLEQDRLGYIKYAAVSAMKRKSTKEHIQINGRL